LGGQDCNRLILVTLWSLVGVGVETLVLVLVLVVY
jgi:hypothetical protein